MPEEEKQKKRTFAVHCRSWDLAVSDKTDADYTVGGLITLFSDGRVFVRDVQRFQFRWPETRERIILTAENDGTIVPIILPVMGQQTALLDDVQDDPRMSLYMVEGVKEVTAKLARAYLWIGHAYRGQIYLVDDGPWIQPFLDECERFTGHDDPADDQIDMLSMAFDFFQQQYPFMLQDATLRPERKKKLDTGGSNGDNHARNERERPPRTIRRPFSGRRTFL